MGNEVVVHNSDKLIELAMSKDIDVAVLERLIELRNREAEREMRIDFECAFAKMQEELPVITATKEVKKDGKVIYRFAPLSTIQRKCEPIVRKHGFSYRWRSEKTEFGIKETFILSRNGYTIENSFESPSADPSSFKNIIQVIGEVQSYGRRYSMIDGLGLVIEGEDNDAQLSFDEVAEYAEEALAIRSCTDLDSLVQSWQTVHARYSGDERALSTLRAIYKKKKKDLTDDSEIG